MLASIRNFLLTKAFNKNYMIVKENHGNLPVDRSIIANAELPTTEILLRSQCIPAACYDAGT